MNGELPGSSPTLAGRTALVTGSTR
ncbi:MAG: hypothetical protein RLZZ440_2081, partial [Planctomycetota bacterium]